MNGTMASAHQPHPSAANKQQIQVISRSRHYSCPEPILLIVSEAANAEMIVKAYVVSKEMFFEELFERIL